MNRTVSALIAGHGEDALAIGAPDREWLTYGGLRRLSTEVAGGLHEIGIGRGDRVAIVLPNGPEMAAAFVTVAQTATTAPLNPAYRQEEYEFYLEDLRARALVVAQDYDGPALAAAAKARHRGRAARLRPVRTRGNLQAFRGRPDRRAATAPLPATTTWR